MRQVVLGLFCLMLWVVASCSTTSNTSSFPLPAVDGGSQTSAFTVETEPGSGTFVPVIDVTEDSAGATVVVRAEDAAELRSAFVELRYDTARYTPVDVQLGDFLGDDTLNLTLTDVEGRVPIAVVQLEGTAANGDGVLGTVRFEARPFVASRGVSAAPQGDKNRVSDLQIVSLDAGSATLLWTEVNVGDYNNNGEVSGSDLVPIALYYNQKVNDTADPIHAGMVDGDGNGEINAADISPIAGNFGSRINGYVLYTNEEASDFLCECPRPEPGDIDPKRPVEYQQAAEFTGSEAYTVRPLGQSVADVGPESNVAEANIVPGPPEDPTGLTAETGQHIGLLKVKLTWTASASSDVTRYLVERKLSSEDDSAYIQVAEVNKSAQPTYTDQGGLTSDMYSYRVRARDAEGLLSGYSNVAEGEPYMIVMPIPTGVNASPHMAGISAIQVTWNAIAGVGGYRVYSKPQADTDFAVEGTLFGEGSTSFIGDGYAEGVTYDFYVVSIDASGTLQSDPSAIDSSTASPATVLQISNLTTDKTTHHVSGSEPASNISVTTNTAPDTFTWSVTPAALGAVTGSGADVTWAPTGNPTPQKVTISVEVKKGAQTDSASIDLYLTSETIKSTLNGGNVIASAGDNFNLSYLDRIATGGNISNKSWSEVSQGRVVMFKKWEKW